MNIRPRPLNKIFYETDWPNQIQISIINFKPKKKGVLTNSAKINEIMTSKNPRMTKKFLNNNNYTKIIHLKNIMNNLNFMNNK